jgi:hypothetical protein
MVAAVTTVEFVTVFRLTNVFVATITSVRRVALAARYNIVTSISDLRRGFGLANRIIAYSLVVTANNYNVFQITVIVT